MASHIKKLTRGSDVVAHITYATLLHFFDRISSKVLILKLLFLLLSESTYPPPDMLP